MDFDDSLFQCGDAAAVSEGEGREREGDSRKKERGKDDEYVAKNCPPEVMKNQRRAHTIAHAQ